MCPSLDAISNGVIQYSPDTFPPFDYQTRATYTCNTGFYLQGLFFAQTCVTGEVWDGSPPICRREYFS